MAYSGKNEGAKIAVIFSKKYFWISFIITGLIVAVFCYQKVSPTASEVIASVQQYRHEADDARLKHFQRDFQKALQSPNRLSWIGKVYTDGLMSHICYTDFGPSFVAFVELHEALYEVMADLVPSDVTLTGEMEHDFWQASDLFNKRVETLSHIKDISQYEEALEQAYQDFVVGFMHRYEVFFKSRFHSNLLCHATKQGYVLDVIDCSFFALRNDAAAHEKHPHKLQCEVLRAYRCDNGKIMILGYNTWSYACIPQLHIYMLDEEKKKLVSIPFMIPN